MVKQLIKKAQGKIEKKVKGKEGAFFSRFYIYLLTLLRPFYFSNEFLLIKGLKKKNKSTQQSILFFSVHKSASTFIKNTVIKIIGDEKLIPINLSGYLSGDKQAKYYNDKKLMSHVLKDKGYFYGAFRAYYDFPEMSGFRILLVLRDPRDVLTSHYFSTLYNHPLSRKEVIEDRVKYSGVPIDEFVLEIAPELADKYNDYCNFLLPQRNVLLLKYEDMINDFPAWIRKLSHFLEVSEKEEMIQQIISETSFVVDKEDPNSFIRNIKAGDHKNKLKQQTIAELNKLFFDSMIKLEYTI